MKHAGVLMAALSLAVSGSTAHDRLSHGEPATTWAEKAVAVDGQSAVHGDWKSGHMRNGGGAPSVEAIPHVTTTSASSFPGAAPMASGAVPSFAWKPPIQYRPTHPENEYAYVNFVSVAVGDITGDSRDDVVALSSYDYAYVRIQTAAGTLSDARIFARARGTSRELVLGDFNEDGVLDIAMGSINPELTSIQGGVNVLMADRAGTFVSRQSLLGVEHPVRSWTIADVDRDGHLDIIGVRNINGGFSYRVMFGDGKGGFPRFEDVDYGSPCKAAEVHAVDLNLDGFPDLAMVLAGCNDLDPSQPGSMTALYHNGFSGFLDPVDLHPAFSSPYDGIRSAFADFDRDGWIDSMIVNDESIEIRWQTSSGFAPPTALDSYTVLRPKAALADFDGDGSIDFVMPQMLWLGMAGQYGLALYLQDGGVPVFWSFTPFEQMNGNLTNDIAAGDINADGCKDVVLAHGTDGLVFQQGDKCRRRIPPLPDERRSPLRR